MKKIRVYIADDHSVVRVGLRTLLESEPDMVVVGQAGNGAEAVAGVQQCRPDVVVMDISMPEMDGLEATRRIRAAGAKTPIVAATASAVASEVAQYESAGMNAFVLKPFDVELLLKTIAEHAGR
jgi:DNA-binding NarL/FixJ family response regulator